MSDYINRAEAEKMILAAKEAMEESEREAKDRDELIAVVGAKAALMVVHAALGKIPPAVVDHVKHVGRWLYSSTENPEYKICPNCGTSFRTDIGIKLRYCPNCGNYPWEGER